MHYNTKRGIKKVIIDIHDEIEIINLCRKLPKHVLWHEISRLKSLIEDF